MTATVLEQAGNQLGSFLPRLAGAILLAVAGIIFAILAGRLVRLTATKLGLDDGAERVGLADVLDRAGLGRSLARLAGRVVRISLIVVVLFAALSLLGLQFLSAALNEGVLFIPRVLLALVLLLAGIVLGAFAREWIERTSAQMDLPVAMGPVAQVIVIGFFALTAAAQIGVSIAPVMLILTVGLIAATAAISLSFGLGSKEIARSLSAARYARADFAVGQTVRVGELRGTIERIDSAATLLRSGGDRIRIPNHLLVEGAVTVEGAEEDL